MRLFCTPGISWINSDGTPMSGGTLSFFETGTINPKSVYNNISGSVNLGTEITLNTAGRAVYNNNVTGIWLETDLAYTVVVKDAAGAAIVTVDNVTGQFDPALEMFKAYNIKLESGRGIYDNNNTPAPYVLFTQASNAVNYLNVTNASAGGDVLIEATGSDTNINLNLGSKGTGIINLLNNASVDGDVTATGNASITGTVESNVNVFSYYQAVGTTLTNNTFTAMVHDTALYTNSEYSISTGQFTPTIKGWYFITGTISINTGDAACSLIAAIAKNGTNLYYSGSRIEAANKLAIISVSGVVYLDGSTDYVTIYGFQDGGSNEVTNISTYSHLNTITGFLISADS